MEAAFRFGFVCVLAAGCTCGTFDPAVTRFACSSTDDCGPGFVCSSTQECVSMVTVESEAVCDDGLDDDGDGFVDCADTDCPTGTRCDDFDGCTLGERCAGDGTCQKSSEVACVTPPNVCYAMTGACVRDAGSCVYTPTGAGGCDDGLACTLGDRCSDGTCTGTQVSCTSPGNSCLAAVGTCTEPNAVCQYAPRVDASCDDGLNCTTDDRCDVNGVCTGMTVGCVPPSGCHASTGACRGDGGCLFSARTGLSCDAGMGVGTCTAAFNCVRNAFQYSPSNFTESQLPSSNTPFNVTCPTILDTTGAAIAGCLSMPAHRIITLAGGGEALLIAAPAFTVAVGQTLGIGGSRPVIFAVPGNVTIAGTIVAYNGGGIAAACGEGGDGEVPASGGGGGGFGSAGGSGGQAGMAFAGDAGPINGTANLVPLRGGCNGGAGTVATGGAGGGAIQVTSGGSMIISGTINAPGRGALASGLSSGGGGGSGGAILLEAATLTIGGTVTANGGGGASFSANDGSDGNASLVPAPGGSGGTLGSGGAGATRGSPAVAGTAGSSLAGGGGGGLGRIRLNAQTCNVAGLISPQPSSSTCP